MAVGLKKMGKPSPVKFWQVAAIQAGVALWGYYSGKKKRDKEAREAKKAQEASRAAYTQQEYKNAYANLENPYEDLTVNQQQAQFQAQQQAQQRADILSSLRGTAGGAGVAGLAQAMANQSTLGTQQISASIGKQEAMNQRLRAQGASKVQQLEAHGEHTRSLREQQRIETLYGMDMGRVTAANKAKTQAKANLYSGLGNAAGSLAGGMAREGMFSGGVGNYTGGLEGATVSGAAGNAFDPNVGSLATSQFGDFGGFGQQGSRITTIPMEGASGYQSPFTGAHPIYRGGRVSYDGGMTWTLQ